MIRDPLICSCVSAVLDQPALVDPVEGVLEVDAVGLDGAVVLHELVVQVVAHARLDGVRPVHGFQGGHRMAG